MATLYENYLNPYQSGVTQQTPNFVSQNSARPAEATNPYTWQSPASPEMDAGINYGASGGTPSGYTHATQLSPTSGQVAASTTGQSMQAAGAALTMASPVVGIPLMIVGKGIEMWSNWKAAEDQKAENARVEAINTQRYNKETAYKEKMDKIAIARQKKLDNNNEELQKYQKQVGFVSNFMNIINGTQGLKANLFNAYNSRARA